MVLRAETSPSTIHRAKSPPFLSDRLAAASSLTLEVEHQRYASAREFRRHGSPMLLESELGDNMPANLFGFGTTDQLRSFGLYTSSLTDDSDLATDSLGGPQERTLHTTTSLTSGRILLAGGKTSPASVTGDCWIFQSPTGAWSRTHSLPTPLYRHAVARLGQTSMALLVGGKTNSTEISNICLLYHPKRGWIECSVSTCERHSVFGATLFPLWSKGSRSWGGLLAGGINQDSTISRQVLEWSLTISGSANPCLSFSPYYSSPLENWLLCRFGASIVEVGKKLLLLGGVTSDIILPKDYEVISVTTRSGGPNEKAEISPCVVKLPITGQVPRPLLIGVSTTSPRLDTFVIMGGGAICCSTGTAWNKGSYTFSVVSEVPVEGLAACRQRESWRLSRTVRISDEPSGFQESQSTRKLAPESIPRVDLPSSESFMAILNANRPVILEQLDLGPCAARWTPNYLKDSVGEAREVCHLRDFRCLVA